MDLRESFPARVYFRAVDAAVTPVCARVFASPDQLTMVGAGLALLVPVGFYFSHWLGLLFMVLSGMADSLDGRLARSQGKSSERGAFLDSCLDRVSDSAYLFGFWVLSWPGGRAVLAGCLIFPCLVFTLMVSYARARGEGLGVDLKSGLMERGARTLFLMALALCLALFPAWFGPFYWGGLAVYCLLTLHTAALRVLRIRRELSG